MTALSITGLTVSYRTGPVLTDAVATVGVGDWLGVIGPNGAGKSTLLKAVAGLVPHQGSVTVDDRPLHTMTTRERARAIGYSPQIPQIPPGISVTDYVLLGRAPYLPALGREGRRDLAVVGDVLLRLDLVSLADRELRTLSGGERQRAVLARVLAQQPRLLLLDEPTTGLDVGHAQALLELVDRLRIEDGVTVVSTLHDLTLAGQYSTRLLLLDHGRVVADGAPQDVLTESLLAAHYDATVAVVTAPDGSRVVAPVRGHTTGP
ncbi:MULTISPECIES: ABC transporter ATP-binding protein [Actinoalloteichus]|uniref:ABC-type cobalamin/Fe3+-siderophore transport system, ATPase component n=1 Tax=Actinoalloteichus fjordicus TaxID=1612552 RepID=A0AAC9PTV7_9PSEU|nr:MULTISPECIES: ABC transporter ATP-binding protein [Actinoalloteichus]APU16296.1 ABC-type cobalamin/Fe3+-siderophore transport system, ATPase component [Actinoalloteichus fjordicus]APU22356.1 ABC-type cobalamin/Fe3+-siderophore transport system, ATPase component [Actinoalloteichus sp. GBA129-24]